MSDFKVNNEELYDELYKYIENLKHDPENRMSNKLGIMIQKIVTGLSCRYNFNNYFYKDEMISLGIYYCCKYLKNYDLSKRNPHGYISKIAENAFRAVINDEKKKLYVKYKSQLMNDSIMNLDNSGDYQIITGTVGDFHKIEQFVKEYEDSKKFKK